MRATLLAMAKGRGARGYAPLNRPGKGLVAPCSRCPFLPHLTAHGATTPTAAAAAASSSPSFGRRWFASSSPPSDSELAQWQSFHSGGLKFLSVGAWEKAALLFMSAMREPAVKETVYQYLSLASMGTAFRHMGKGEEARQVLLQALHALKTYSDVTDAMTANLYREAALACEALGKWDEAEGLLQHSLHYYAQHTLAREHLASSGAPSATSAANEKAEQAKLLLETAATHYTLALLIHKTAAIDTSSASAASPTAAKPTLQVQLRLREAHKHIGDAIRLMRAVYGQDPSSKAVLSLAPVLASAGTIARQMRQTEEAAALWMQALEIYQAHQDPRLVDLLVGYMDLLKEQNPEFTEALEAQEKAMLGEAPTKPEATK